MNIKHSLTILATGAALVLGGLIPSVQAKDTEIFFANQNTVSPNVLFILDSSDSMAQEVTGEDDKSRMQILQEALNQVLLVPYVGLNVGIMDFNKDRGGGIDFPVSDINADAHNIDPSIPAGSTVKHVLENIAESYTPDGNTPIADALYQASSYFLGSNIYNTGNRGKPKRWNTTNNRYEGNHRLSDNPVAYEGGTWGTRGEDSARDYDCSKLLPSSDENSCFNPRFDRFSCENSLAQPRICLIQEKICDSTGLECIWKTIETIDPVIGDDPVDPDGSINKYRVRCSGPNSAGQQCHGFESRTNFGFDTTPTYVSPIIGQCQESFIVLLSDGEPTRQTARNRIAERVEPVSGGSNVSDCDNLSDYTSRFIKNNGRCLPELAKYMSTEDQAPNIPGKQTITTHTIGFALGDFPQAKKFLELLSNHGQGKFFDTSEQEGELASTLKELFKGIANEETDFVAPSVSIDRNNLLATSEYVYLSSFTPSARPGWEGDITRYRITESGFSDNDTLSMASLLTNARTVYTYTGNYNDNVSTQLINVDLTIGNTHRVTETNTNLTAALLELTDDSERDNIIGWARGIDTANNRSEAHKHMGDPMHTKPVLISYTGSDNRDILYATTNDGYLHAFDVTGDTPSELFAFIPQELLPNLQTLYNNVAPNEKVYGLDGEMSVWQTDSNVTLYFGMRRGGRNYYALDVTDPDTPVLKWVIKGGIPGTDFEELGQSWSTPLLTTVKTAAPDPVLALIFGGGYDTKQDDTSEEAQVRRNDDMGRAVFVVDANNGNLLWSAGPEAGSLELKNSVPGNIRAIDLNDNGLADRLYFGDTGGRVWRIDLDENNVANSSGYKLADFNAGSTENNRRFYYPPSVAFSHHDGEQKLMLAIGSGYRAHPLATGVQDRFYVFEDSDATLGRPSPIPSAISGTDLTDISGGRPSNSGPEAGWYINLGSNEKVLAESLIFNSNVSFTTYTPIFDTDMEVDDPICDLNSTARVYTMRLSDGEPALKNENGTPTRVRSLTGTEGIPGAPYIVFNDPNANNDNNDDDNDIPLGRDEQTADLYVGKEIIDQMAQLTERIFWRQIN